ncbi:MAG: hypothetical protein A2937_03830 [Candidatus Yonathbacteria bacterium RIFCSPLOWO2_01_FULL_47_33b]|uniref:Uncharacterized protein n=1 Tax=Candidatus Yonathbacteria bacterium RIFCSPLOWO2_01_FULL_47_33b TaxID=1802727 RepID=A0A1G2SFF2_9BACT|nr:MAG: hypothetical protein A2937_03830 [Candidatus Yonathbacteria bacterium RIFCSPLOWO2_01_FULL_47_33b]
MGRRFFPAKNLLILGAFRAEYRTNQAKRLRTPPKGDASLQGKKVIVVHFVIFFDIILNESEKNLRGI